MCSTLVSFEIWTVTNRFSFVINWSNFVTKQSRCYKSVQLCYKRLQVLQDDCYKLVFNTSSPGVVEPPVTGRERTLKFKASFIALIFKRGFKAPLRLQIYCLRLLGQNRIKLLQVVGNQGFKNSYTSPNSIACARGHDYRGGFKPQAAVWILYCSRHIKRWRQKAV